MLSTDEVARRLGVKPQTVYVDTDTGLDEESTPGSESKPYKSLAFAYIQHGGADGTSYLSRASTTGPVSADGDPAERLVWKEPAKSAVKKAQGALDAHKKKLQRQQQAAAQEQEKEKKSSRPSSPQKPRKARLQNMERVVAYIEGLEMEDKSKRKEKHVEKSYKHSDKKEGKHKEKRR